MQPSHPGAQASELLSSLKTSGACDPVVTENGTDELRKIYRKICEGLISFTARYVGVRMLPSCRLPYASTASSWRVVVIDAPEILGASASMPKWMSQFSRSGALGLVAITMHLEDLGESSRVALGFVQQVQHSPKTFTLTAVTLNAAGEVRSYGRRIKKASDLDWLKGGAMPADFAPIALRDRPGHTQKLVLNLDNFARFLQS